MFALPTPSAESHYYSQQLCELVQKKIIASGGWINFADFMQMALYTPALGYYSGELPKFCNASNGGGDFVTAPQLTPLFAQSLAKQVAQVLSLTQGDVLELGAGTGELAADLLLALAHLEQLPNQYAILEVSSHLRSIQQENLKQKLPIALFEKVIWLDTLPTNFVGMILGNEVLDAIPVHLLVKKEGKLFERGVGFDHDFKWQDYPLQNNALSKQLEAVQLPDDYVTEVCPAASGLIRSLASALQTGVILMIDYGFSASEYYHPQRNEGTLMCHYQHYAHSNPFINLGLQDITAHVNFTAIAAAGLAQGLNLHGYCNQAQFLINCGILDLLSLISPEHIETYMPMSTAVQKLLSPAEMGDLFKVISFTKNLAENDDLLLLGFVSGDKSHTL
ncbi:MAG: SAM-dependent methyltransferase [Methylophilaceae bacterium]|nr:MAG: SAM-dependent methyltransferase [Methylophilaceae bacterium]